MMEVLIAVSVIIIFIVLNGLFVASEFAIVTVPKTIVESQAAKGDSKAARVLRILDDPRKQDQFIATAQLGITISSLALGMYGERVLAEWILLGLSRLGIVDDLSSLVAHSTAGVVAIGLLTYFHIVVGEMIPKSCALLRPNWTIQVVAPFVFGAQWILFPFVKSLNAAGNYVLRAFGVRRRAEGLEHFRTPEELAFIVEESQKGGKLQKEAASVFQELLEFGELTAGEAMVPRTMVVGIPENASDVFIHRLLKEQPHSRYPVFSQTLDQIIGMVHVKDVLRCLPKCGPHMKSIIRAVPFVPMSASLEEVLKAMNQAHSQMAVVMDEQGGTAGLITIEDLFEEVVGDIREDSTERSEIFRDTYGLVHAAGTARIENVGEFFGVELDHEEVDTVSGLILASVGRPASVGDVVEYQGYRFKVVSTKGRGVRECTVEPIPHV